MVTPVTGHFICAQLSTDAISALQCSVQCCFMSTETVGLLGTRSQDGHLDLHTAPELCARAPKGFGTKKNVEVSKCPSTHVSMRRVRTG